VPAVAIACPYCSHRIKLKPANAGRYRLRCPNCALPLLARVPEEPGAEVVVRAPSDDTLATSRKESKAPLPALSAVSASTGLPAALGGGPGPCRSHVFGPPREEGSHHSPGPGLDSDDLDDEPPLPARAEIRGYVVERELGRGGMGRVYLARQLSLDRPVALKVMSRRWAADPVFVARFTREAFAAAQLAHPNIVQIHDIGESDGRRFFSMEYVRGRSLADVVKERGKLDPETAVGYVLQAARGLKYAHDRGMIHRDVKPDNLLLDDQGLVKVADLGLVKTSDGGCGPGDADTERIDASAVTQSDLRMPDPALTGARVALGTPAYMSPEQCRDAAAVDHRADIYSLGCTLYALVTGRPPFDGTSAVELMSKHAYDQLVPPEQIVSRVPMEISAVIQRMMAKDAADRYRDMGEVVRTLEAWLGVRHTGTFSPREEQIARLEESVSAFNACAPAVLRARVASCFFGSVALSAVLLAFFGKLGWAFGVFGLALQASLAYFALDGVLRRGYLFGCTRRLLEGMGWGDIVVSVAGFAMFCLLLSMSNVFWIWAGFGAAGVGLALAVCCVLDRAVLAHRRAALEGCERQLRRLRLQGLDEEQLRQFVAKFAGRHWEEFFEALFGFEAKLAARAHLLRGGAAGAREKHGTWREPLIAWMERVEKSRKEARERRLLAAVERAKLLADGASARSAERQANAAADAMVRAADEIRKAETRRAAPGLPTAQAPASVRKLVQVAERPEEFAPAERGDAFARFAGLFVGPHVRAVAAAVLLAACAVWAYQNGHLPGAATRQPAAPLLVPGVPAVLTGWADGFNAGLAGIMLLGSLYLRGNLMSAFALIGAAVTVAGHHCGIRALDPFRDYHISLMLGALLATVGFRMGTR
jgi:serine/threonine protein kinase